MQYKVGDKVRLKSWDIVTIQIVRRDDSFSYVFIDKDTIVYHWMAKLSEIESIIIDIDGSNLEKLEAQCEAMQKTIAQLKKEIIYVPDCIKFTKWFSPFSMWLENIDWYQLYYKYQDNWYMVEKADEAKYIKTKLVKTTWWELSPWDWCYDNVSLSCIKDIEFYWLKLADNTMQNWADKDCLNETNIKNITPMYKVVLVD